MTGGICVAYDGRLGPGMGDVCRFSTCQDRCQRKVNERARMTSAERETLFEGTAAGPNLDPLANRLWTDATSSRPDADVELLELWRLLRDVFSRGKWFAVGDMSTHLLTAAAAREWLREHRYRPTVKDVQVYLELMNPEPGGDMPNTNPNAHQVELVLMALRDMEK